MAHTNRLPKILSKYIAGARGIRAATKGVLFDGRTFAATDGHKAVWGISGDDEPPMFDAPGVYDIDESQALNADFFEAPHHRMGDAASEYPNIGKAIPQEYGVDVNSVTLGVDVLYDFARFLKKIEAQSVTLHIPEGASDRDADIDQRAITFRVNNTVGLKVSLQELAGMIMPYMHPEKTHLAPQHDRKEWADKLVHAIDSIKEQTNNEAA